MYKYREYECENKECISYQKLVERFVLASSDDQEECDHCLRLMKKVLSACRGYVKGSRTPCRQL